MFLYTLVQIARTDENVRCTTLISWKNYLLCTHVFTVHFKNTNDNHQLLDLSLESPEKAVIVVVNDEINRFLNFESKLNSLLPRFRWLSRHNWEKNPCSKREAASWQCAVRPTIAPLLLHLRDRRCSAPRLRYSNSVQKL